MEVVILEAMLIDYYCDTKIVLLVEIVIEVP